MSLRPSINQKIWVTFFLFFFLVAWCSCWWWRKAKLKKVLPRMVQKKCRWVCSDVYQYLKRLYWVIVWGRKFAVNTFCDDGSKFSYALRDFFCIFVQNGFVPKKNPISFLYIFGLKNAQKNTNSILRDNSSLPNQKVKISAHNKAIKLTRQKKSNLI